MNRHLIFVNDADIAAGLQGELRIRWLSNPPEHLSEGLAMTTEGLDLVGHSIGPGLHRVWYRGRENLVLSSSVAARQISEPYQPSWLRRLYWRFCDYRKTNPS